MPEEMSKEVKFEYPGTNSLNSTKEVNYEKLVDKDIINWLKEESGKSDSERKVSKKTEKKIVKKVLAYSATFMILSAGGFITLAETGHLPEPAQVWYDTTSEKIRAVFGIEEASEEFTNLVEETEPEEFTGLELKGLNHIWQNNRWEYVDPNDSLVAGFWSEKEGKYEHTANVLRGEWLGLFNTKSTQEVEKMLSQEGWIEENWQNGKIKVPLPFMITKGGTIEEIETNVLNNRATILAVSDLSAGKTDILSPIGQPKGVLFSPSDPPTPSSIHLIKGNVELSFLFASRKVLDQFLNNVMGPDMEIKIGDKLLELTNETISSSRLKLLSLLLDKDKYQLLLTIGSSKTGNALNFSFKNLLTDEKGRFILMVPSLNLEKDSFNNKK